MDSVNRVTTLNHTSYSECENIPNDLKNMCGKNRFKDIEFDSYQGGYILCTSLAIICNHCVKIDDASYSKASGPRFYILIGLGWLVFGHFFVLLDHCAFFFLLYYAYCMHKLKHFYILIKST